MQLKHQIQRMQNPTTVFRTLMVSLKNILLSIQPNSGLRQRFQSMITWSEGNFFSSEMIYLPGSELSRLEEAPLACTSSSADLLWKSNSEALQFLEHRCMNHRMQVYRQVSKNYWRMYRHQAATRCLLILKISWTSHSDLCFLTLATRSLDAYELFSGYTNNVK